MEGKTIENILINLTWKNTAVRNNGGGFYNHNLFLDVMMTLMETDFNRRFTNKAALW
jgi:superoxide dismutase